MLRKTKIVCTLGPSTDQEGVMRNMIVSGMNVARFNFSHGSHEEHAARLAKLQELSKADLTNGEIQQRMVFSCKILRYYDRYAKINLGKRLAASPPQEGKE